MSHIKQKTAKAIDHIAPTEISAQHKDPRRSDAFAVTRGEQTETQKLKNGF